MASTAGRRRRRYGATNTRSQQSAVEPPSGPALGTDHGEGQARRGIDDLFLMVASSNPNRTDAALYGVQSSQPAPTGSPSTDDGARGSTGNASTTSASKGGQQPPPEKRKRGRPRKNGGVVGVAGQPAVKRQKARVIDNSVHEIRVTLRTLRKLFAEYEKRLESSGSVVNFEELRASLGPRLEPCELSPIDLEFIVNEFTASKYRPTLGAVLMERPGSFQPSTRQVGRLGLGEVGERLRQLWKEHKENTPVSGDDVAADRIRANGAVRWLKGCATTSTLSSTAWDYWSAAVASPVRPSGRARLSSFSTMEEASPYGFVTADRRLSTATISPIVGGGIFETIY
ncbi:hypothetical protein FOZ62_009320 [Perkinsus olseni]|uniref:Uncharacterized protein n=1 Tax=Perkinsus olseni TaxID=32597 RepID=A0A7J6U6V5_PEROL|nr:hypothetical protein FOZ62_009320 [Perkinsus olseni]